MASEPLCQIERPYIFCSWRNVSITTSALEDFKSDPFEMFGTAPPAAPGRIYCRPIRFQHNFEKKVSGGLSATVDLGTLFGT